MGKWFQNVWEYASRFWRPKYRLEVSEEEPDTYKSRTVYLLGGKESAWAATFECPCGCDAKVWLNLLPAPGRPRWEVERNKRGRFSITPSIWRLDGCRSHFFLRESRIVWCPTMRA